MRCSECGRDHPESHIEPFFERPDPYLALSPGEREKAKADRDLCMIGCWDEDGHRCFVRTVLFVPVRGRDRPIGWGLWVEVPPATFRCILESWRDEADPNAAPFSGRLANNLPGYPPSLDLPVLIRPSGPNTRPIIEFSSQVVHPFAGEAATGVTEHRVAEWLSLLK